MSLGGNKKPHTMKYAVQ
ncbi:Protein of unknown function [Bacillus mycoides]|nr:Protein of unknown function [Bacillus mycoides]